MIAMWKDYRNLGRAVLATLLVGLALCGTGSAPARADSITLNPRADYDPLWPYTTQDGKTFYWVLCCTSGKVTFANAANQLDAVYSSVGPFGNEEEAGGATAANMVQTPGTGEWSYKIYCTTPREYQWDGFYNTIDKAYHAIPDPVFMDLPGLLIEVAEGNDTWTPGLFSTPNP